MALNRGQSWLTYVTNDDSANNAIVLAESLRKVRTTRRICAITCDGVSLEKRVVLRRHFDHVFYLEASIIGNRFGRKLKGDFSKNDGLRAKAFAFSLKLFEKCVLIGPDAIVLENADKLFEGKEDTFQDLTNGLSNELFLFTPCVELCDYLEVTNWNEGNGKPFASRVKQWIKNNNNNLGNTGGGSNLKVHAIPKVCIMQFDLEQKQLKLSKDDFWSPPGIVQFLGCKGLGTKLDTKLRELGLEKETLGLTEKVIVENWLEIFDRSMENGSAPANKFYENEPIAIIGMSCRFPGANNLDDFWKLLYEGQEGIREPPAFRWKREHVVYPSTEKERQTKAGFLSTPVDEFDAKFFGVSPKDALLLDPQARMLHEVLWEGLENAGIDPTSLYGSHTGIFAGSWMNDYKDIIQASMERDFYRTYMGNSIGATAARLSFLLGLTGPSIATESGCSSAIVALDLAIKSLRNGESHLALAGGVNMLLHPFQSNIIDYVIAPDGRCKTFDEKADGFGRAEGCGVLVLKRLSDALRDKDNIWALIRGSAVSQEGLSRSLGTPTVHCEALAMELALKDAGVRPEQVTFVETHGTGTTVGDPMEVAAIAKAYHTPARKDPLIIGSVKTNVGHTESCSGITGIIKTVLAMQHELIPKHLNLDTLNPQVNLEAIPAEIPLEPIAWPKTAGQPRIAGVSSFGITGTDGHVILEEAPDYTLPRFSTGLERPLHLIKFSAKTKEGLDEVTQLYGETFKNVGSNLFPDVAFTANSGRASFGQRAFLLASTYDEALKAIEGKKLVYGELNNTTNLDGKICFLFTGQGSQYAGMAKSLYESSPVFQFHFDQCNFILKSRYNLSILPILWGDKENDSTQLSRTIYSQASIFVIEFCLLKLWESWGIKPDYVLGHSLGEFCAAVAAGILTFEDALTLVAERSLLIDKLPCGRMLVIKSNQQEVEKLMEQNEIKLDFAAVNSQDQTVVAGDTETVQNLLKICKELEIKAVILEASHAFHSRHMNPMLEEYRKIAQTIIKPSTNKPKCQYISGMEGRLIDDPISQMNAEYWVRHTRERVSFLDACKAMKAPECQEYLELGPQPVLSSFVMQNIEDYPVSCYPSLRRNTSDWETILTTLGKLYLQGYKIDWEGYDRPFERKKVSTLPFHPFHRKSFWVECQQVRAPEIHPLLGWTVANASVQSIFQNDVNLKYIPFLKDHCIGNITVFPGAGFTEMCLTAGYCVANAITEILDKPRRPIALENVRIEAPLELKDGKTTRLQTIVRLLDTEDGAPSGYECKVFHQSTNEHGENGSSKNWVVHASATFLPFVSTTSVMEKWKPERVRELIQSEPCSMDAFYKTVDGVGLKFGEQFRTLKRHWFVSQEGGMDEVVAELKVPEENYKYIIHPCTIDAMIQGGMVCGLRTQSEALRVPIGLGKLSILRSYEDNGNEDGTLFLHAKWEGSQCQVFLATKNLEPLAFLEGIDVIETNVKTIQSVLEQQNSKIPDSWEENWKPITGPLDNRIKLELVEPLFSNKEFRQKLKSIEEVYTSEDEEQKIKMDRLIYLYCLKALLELGWTPEVGESIEVKSFCEKHKILPTHHQLLAFYFRIFEQENDFIKISQKHGDDGSFWTIEAVTHSDIKTLVTREAQDLFEELKDKPRISVVTRTYNHIASQLPDILVGEKSILPILFPTMAEGGQQEEHDYSAETYYKKHPGRVEGAHVFSTTVRSIIQFTKELDEGNTSAKKTVRILEVGGGTGSLTVEVLSHVTSEWNGQVLYYFTDISQSFFAKLEKQLVNCKANIKFCTFNIEDSPLEQGIPLNEFDLVFASDVLHVTKNLRQCLRNLRQTMKPRSTLLFTDTFRQNSPITFVFGLLSTYWRFEDFDIRPNHTCVDGPTWKRLLLEEGFDFVNVSEVYMGVMGCVTAGASTAKGYEVSPRMLEYSQTTPGETKKWIIFSPGNNQDLQNVARVLNANGDDVSVILPPSAITETYEESILTRIREELVDGALQGIIYAWGMDQELKDQRRIALPFMHIAKHVLEMKKPPKVYIFTKGVHAIVESQTDFNPSTATLSGMSKSLKNESSDLFVRYVDLDGEYRAADSLTDQILFEMTMNRETREKERVSVAYREDQRYEPKFCKGGLPQNPARDDLQLPPSSERYKLVLPETRTINDLTFDVLEEEPLGENEVEISIKAYALNFRDIFAVLKPTKEFENENGVGLDFAGVVTKVGRDIPEDKLKTGDRVFGVKLKQIPMPSHVTLDVGDVVKIPEKMTFAEAATLPAVFATSYHCLITVAQMKKGETVLIHTGSGGVGLSAIQLAQHVGAKIITTAGSHRKRSYLRSLGIEHVFHSRDTSYEDEIMKVTNGRGVDIVLNSITGPGFKEATLDVCAKNARFIEMSKLAVWTEDEVRERRADVEYKIVDLTVLERSTWEKILDSMKTYLYEERVLPIPHVQFDALRVRQALQYLQKAKHIGKVVVKMPELKTVGGHWSVQIPLFNADSTYVITGGLGGIGFEVCKWMLEKGATDIVLIGRNPPKPEVAKQVEQLNSSYNGGNVMVKLADVSDYAQCAKVLEDIRTTCPKPIRGIQHCAGVLCDNLYANQTWESFMTSFKPKIDGSWNLHNLTRDLRLEHFILYSSITALMGTPGQANHASANCFEDAFAQYRYSLGLPATTVNWGQWSQVGCAKEVNVTGVLPVSVKRMLNGLEEVLRSQRLQVAFGEFESLSSWCLVCPSFKYYLDERLMKAMKAGSGQGQILLKSDQFWQEMDEAPGKQEKMETAMKYMKVILRGALRMEDDEHIDEDSNMKDLGVDSLMLIELKNTIQSLLGSRLTVTANMLKDCNTIRDLATCIVNRIYEDSESEPQLSPEELIELMKVDCSLDESIQPPTEPLKSVEDIKTVLITGCTGQLGPYLISSLCQVAPSVEKIVCLIRAKDEKGASEKLNQVLKNMKLLEKVDMSKVECIRGEVTQPEFGLEKDKYFELANSVDGVFHLAVKSNHLEHYRKSQKDFEGTDIRSVNVGGTLNILKFATAHKTKHVYYASSILAVVGGGDDPTALSDQWPESEDMKQFTEVVITGYPITKYVSEMLLKQAVERGIPCKAFRFPWIMGDSQTGQLNYTQNHYILRFLSYLKVKAMPDTAAPAVILPVDLCAEISLKLFWNPEAGDEIYNIAHPNPQLEVEFVQVAKEEFGTDLELVEWKSKEFVEKLYQKGMPLRNFSEIYEDVDRGVEIIRSKAFKAIEGYINYPMSFFKNKKVERLLPGFAQTIPSGMETLKNDLKYVKSTGFFDKFGL